MEHVGTQIEHCPFVDLIILVINDRFLWIFCDEVFNAAWEVALPLANRWETLFVEIAEADKDVHQSGRRHGSLIDEKEELLCRLY